MEVRQEKTAAAVKPDDNYNDDDCDKAPLIRGHPRPFKGCRAGVIK